MIGKQFDDFLLDFEPYILYIKVEGKPKSNVNLFLYSRSDDTVVLRISPKERGHLVIQIGTSDVDRAIRVAKMVSL